MLAGVVVLSFALIGPAEAHDGPEMELTLSSAAVAAGQSFSATVTTGDEPCLDLSLTFGEATKHVAGTKLTQTFTAPADATGDLPVVATCTFADNHNGETSETSNRSTWITVTAAPASSASAGPPSTTVSAQDDSTTSDNNLGMIVAISLGSAVVIVGLGVLWWRRARHP